MRKLTKEEFIEKAKKIHGDKYDYSKVEYINNRTKVCIICPIHGEFSQTPNSHLNGSGCYDCGLEKSSLKQRLSKEEFIEKAKKVHGDKYDYSKVNYINNHTDVCIICPIHGEFPQEPNDHLQGCGCPKCKGVDKGNYGSFIGKAKKVHGNKYDYSKVNYINNRTRVIITCPIHGDFPQTPHEHFIGCGCPLCQSSKLENEFRLYLQNNNIEFEEQKKFDWLGKQSLDFYLPQYNVAIECQGVQHFQSVDFFGGHNGLLQTKVRDSRKRRLCEENGVKLLYYSNLGIDYPYEVFEDKDKLLEEINKN